ncbi:MAG: 3-oxoacyl-ACP reductase FabG, partial [Treponema sp.]|nr:3-oxoacyl-ACP reductase FabG [Treponema sp.]
MEKKVLITGAGRGIGRAIALAVSEAGYTVIAHYNSSEAQARSLEDEIRSHGGKAELLKFDVSNRDECQRVLDAWTGENGALWGIVNNAGITADDAFPAMSAEKWDRVVHTNLDSFYNVLHPLIMPLCRKKRGRIITIASVAGIIGNRGQTNYSASKAGIIGASKALAVELASRSITVNCIAPGVIETEMIKDAPLDRIIPVIPMGRAGKPEEVAALAVFLLSE